MFSNAKKPGRLMTYGFCAVGGGGPGLATCYFDGAKWVGSTVFCLVNGWSISWTELNKMYLESFSIYLHFLMVC